MPPWVPAFAGMTTFNAIALHRIWDVVADDIDAWEDVLRTPINGLPSAP
jgi:hypothetical protein